MSILLVLLIKNNLIIREAGEKDKGIWEDFDKKTRAWYT